MKALFIANDLSVFDTASTTYAHLANYANAIGTLHVLARAPERMDVGEGNFIVHGIPGGALDGARALVARARELIAAESIDVVSAQDPFEQGWVAMQAVKGTAAKLHVQVHTDFLSPWFIRPGVFRSPQVSVPVRNRIRQTLANQVLPKAAGIRVVSERVAQSLVARYGSRIVTPSVIPLFVSGELPEPVELPRHEFPFALITVSKLEPDKRIQDIIEAIASIKDRYPAIGLIIVGEGSERTRLMTMVMERNLTGRIVFAGARPDAWGLMRSAQAYIQAPAYEGYSRALVEAALARIPIITSDVGLVGEVFTGFEDVLAAPPGDPAQLAVHMAALLQDVATRQVLIRSAEQKAREHLDKYPDLTALVAADLARLVTPSP